MTPAAMAAIHERAFAGQSRAWSATEFQELMQDNQVFCVHKPLGFALGRVLGHEAELLTLATDPSLQRQGIGCTLMQDFSRELTYRGVETVFLEVAQDNVAALALYTALGYIQVGCRKDYYRKQNGALVDGLVMRCTI